MPNSFNHAAVYAQYYCVEHAANRSLLLNAIATLVIDQFFLFSCYTIMLPSQGILNILLIH